MIVGKVDFSSLYINLSGQTYASLADTRDCPFCCSSIPISATRCPNCTSEVEAMDA